MPYWSKKLANLCLKLSKARQSMEQNPNAENVAEHKGLKEKFIKTQTSELQQSWHQKTSLSLESSTGKLWHPTKALNEDVRRRGVLEDDNIFHTGKRGAYLLGDAFQAESTVTIPTQRRKEVGILLQAQLQEQTDAFSTITTDFYQSGARQCAETPPLSYIVFLTDCPYLLSKAYSQPESSWIETHSAFSMTCCKAARWLSSGSLFTVGLQETRWIDSPSLEVNNNSPT